MLSYANGDEARQGGTDIVISLTPGQAAAIGMELAPIGDWLDTVVWALALLRTGSSQDGSPVTVSEWGTVITHLSHRLSPRLEGILDAVMRAHEDAGGSVGQLALAMDVPRSTAQYRRETLRGSEPSVWESWARGDSGKEQT